MNAKDKALKFLEVKKHFQLGSLPTEMPHPRTVRLSELAENNLSEGVSVLRSLDLDLLDTVWDKRGELVSFISDIKETIDAGGRIFLCGCGATGRLSIVLETLWREVYSDHPLFDSAISFMAGGDCALIKSIEKFEDYPEYGARQLLDLGFSENDLLISTTEGGETPFVIGATEEAARVSKRSPYFLYCNPDEILCKVAERSKKVIELSDIKKINLFVGPMGLTGSTRMQASSILMLFVGLGLQYYDKQFSSLESELLKFIDFVKNFDFSFLVPFIEKEAALYQNDQFLFYECDEAYGISVITDTTERSPTFSLNGFENIFDETIVPCWSYLLFPEADSSEEAWEKLLRRSPRTFKWDDVDFKTDRERILGYDFSSELIDRRLRYSGSDDHRFKIYRSQNGILFSFEGLEYEIPTKGFSNLYEHTLLKFLLNIHSTLLMGRLKRYRNNIMTWVRPSNNKLIDRTVRYISLLLKDKGIIAEYDDLVHRCYHAIDKTKSDESVVEFVCSQFIE